MSRVFHTIRKQSLARGGSLTRSSTVAGPRDRSRRVPRPVPSCGPEPGWPPAERWLIMSAGGKGSGDVSAQEVQCSVPRLYTATSHHLQVCRLLGTGAGFQECRILHGA